MRLQSYIRHCLYLNWALPVDALPALPEPLRYQTCDHEGESFAFVSALFFRHDEARFASLPLLRMSFPQLNLRLCVLDDDDVPAVYFQRSFVPSWALLPIRLLTRQPATNARFRYPHPSSLGPWEWSVRSNVETRCRAELFWLRALCHLEDRTSRVGYEQLGIEGKALCDRRLDTE